MHIRNAVEPCREKPPNCYTTSNHSHPLELQSFFFFFLVILELYCPEREKKMGSSTGTTRIVYSASFEACKLCYFLKEQLQKSLRYDQSSTFYDLTVSNKNLLSIWDMNRLVTSHRESLTRFTIQLLGVERGISTKCHLHDIVELLVPCARHLRHRFFISIHGSQLSIYCSSKCI